MQNRGHLDWIPALKWRTLVSFGREFTSDGAVLLVLYTALCVLGVASVRSTGARRPGSGLSAGVLVLWMLLPIVTLASVSLVKPMFIAADMLMSVPALALLAAIGIDYVRGMGRVGPILAGTVVVVILGQSLLTDVAQYRAVTGAPNHWRGMTEAILARARPADAAIFYTTATHMSFTYYASRPGARSSASGAPTIVIPDFGRTPSGIQPIPSRAEIRSAIEGRARLWLVLNIGSIGLVPARREALPMIRGTLTEEFELADQQRIGRFVVELYERKGG